MLILAAGADPSCVAALRVTAKQHTLDNVSDVSLLIEGDFIGQAEIAVALPVVQEYLARAVVRGWVVERLPGGEGLILRGKKVFDERGFRLLYNGQKKCDNYHGNGRQV